LLPVPASRVRLFLVTTLLLGAALPHVRALAQEPAQAAPHPPAASTAAQETMEQGEATGTLGRVVIGPDTKVVGRIVEVLVDQAGEPRAAVLDVGGFLGVGSRRVAVAWRALHFNPSPDGQGRIVLDMTADQIRATPEYKPAGKPVTLAAPPQAGQTKP
jgi:hypothetical protein